MVDEETLSNHQQELVEALSLLWTSKHTDSAQKFFSILDAIDGFVPDTEPPQINHPPIPNAIMNLAKQVKTALNVDFYARRTDIVATY